MKTNWKKIPAITGSAFFCFASVFATDNGKGIEYYRAELYDAAKIYFENQIKQNQGEDLAECYYYIGECYAATEELDSAAYFYQKAIQANPEYPYSYIGEGKLSLKRNNAVAANDFFKKAIGFAKKNPAVHTAVAEAYIDVEQYDKAEDALDKARSVKKTFSGIFVAEGDMLMQQGNSGNACAKYDNAIYFDANDKVAYLKVARVYKTINPDLALEYLEKLLAIDPEYIPAYVELGDTYSHDKKKMYTKALEAYDKFITIPGMSAQQQANYALLLYYIKDYTRSLAVVDNALAKNPQNSTMLRRLQIYNNYELESYRIGLEKAEKFIQTVAEKNLVVQDFVYYGRLLDKNNKLKEAIEAYNKAISMDEKGNQTEIYKDLALAYEKEEDYANTIVFYKKFIENDINATLSDVRDFGRICYRAGNKKIDATTMTPEEVVADSLIRRDYLLQADTLFARVVEGAPENHIGYFWRARTNASLDPETVLGIAKPHYEQAAAKLEAAPEGASRNDLLIECYRYLAYYYYLPEDKPKDKSNCEMYALKILELDTENTIAKDFLRAIKSPRAPK